MGEGEFLNADLIRSVEGFENMPEGCIEILARSAWRRRYFRGVSIYVEGDPAEHVYLIESGWVKAARLRRDGRQQWMRVIGPGDIFGDVAVLSGEPYPATVLALEPLVAWIIPAKVINDLMGDATFAAGMARRSSLQVLRFARLVEDLALKNVEERLICTLFQYAEYLDGNWEIPRRDWTTFDEMAARLGTVRDVLGRALRTLERENAILVEMNRIVILDEDRFLRITGVPRG